MFTALAVVAFTSSMASAAFITLADFESNITGTVADNTNIGGVTARYSSGVTSAGIVTPGLAGSTKAYSTTMSNGTFDYVLDIPFDNLMDLDTANSLLQITVRYDRSTAGDYNSPALLTTTIKAAAATTIRSALTLTLARRVPRSPVRSTSRRY